MEVLLKVAVTLTFLAVMKIGTWNVRGMRTRARQNEIIEFARQERIDILAIQETYVNDVKFIKSFDRIFDLKSFWSFSNGRSGGVAICIFGKYRDMIIKHERDFEGRIVAIDLNSGYRILNIYSPVRSSDQIPFYNNMDFYVTNVRKLILLGDFNCVENEVADRMPARDRKLTYGARSWIDLKNRCNLFDCWNKVNPYTPKMTWSGGKFKARLDRIYATENMSELVTNSSIEQTPLSDHSLVTVTIKTSDMPRGRGVWKMNPNLLGDNRVDTEIRELLGRELRNGVTPTSWDDVKCKVKSILMKWGRAIAKENRDALRKVSDALTLLNKEGTTGPGLREAKERLKQKYDNILKNKWDIVRLKLKTEKWERENWATKHLLNKSLDTCRHEITIIKDEETGAEISDQEEIKKRITKFFETLYKKQKVSFNEEDLRFPDLARGTDGTDFTSDELKKALDQLNDNKAPGEDGLRPAFYRKYWYLIAAPFVTMISEAWKSEEIPESFYEGRIVLICKDPNNKSTIKAWRPVTLLNTDYKLIMKAISNRISDILPDIVSDTQAANIFQRSSQLNVIAISDIIHWTNVSNNAGIIVAIDSEKAFDRVSHIYMEHCLKKVRVHEKLIKIIMLMYKKGRSRVLVNGSLTKAFPVERGVRQGCPLSAALFIITMEPFLQMIKQKIPPFFLPVAGKTVPVFAFADDVTVIVENVEHVPRVLQICEDYGKLVVQRSIRKKVLYCVLATDD